MQTYKLGLLISFVLTLGACTTAPAGSLRAMHDQARLDYQAQCMDTLIDERNQPMSIAHDTCIAHSWRVFPPKRTGQ